MQSNKTLLNITMVFILVTSLNAAAQQKGGGQGRQPPTPAIDTALDSDGDQTINTAEIANAAVALSELDTNNDGELTFVECMGFPERGGQQASPTGRGGSDGQPPAPPVFSALDTSSDGIIDGNELSDASQSLRKLDSNGDGALQSGEYKPSRPSGRMGGRPQRSQ